MASILFNPYKSAEAKSKIQLSSSVCKEVEAKIKIPLGPRNRSKSKEVYSQSQNPQKTIPISPTESGDATIIKTNQGPSEGKSYLKKMASINHRNKHSSSIKGLLFSHDKFTEFKKNRSRIHFESEKMTPKGVAAQPPFPKPGIKSNHPLQLSRSSFQREGSQTKLVSQSSQIEINPTSKLFSNLSDTKKVVFNKKSSSKDLLRDAIGVTASIESLHQDSARKQRDDSASHKRVSSNVLFMNPSLTSLTKHSRIQSTQNLRAESTMPVKPSYHDNKLKSSFD